MPERYVLEGCAFVITPEIEIIVETYKQAIDVVRHAIRRQPSDEHGEYSGVNSSGMLQAELGEQQAREDSYSAMFRSKLEDMGLPIRGGKEIVLQAVSFSFDPPAADLFYQYQHFLNGALSQEKDWPPSEEKDKLNSECGVVAELLLRLAGFALEYKCGNQREANQMREVMSLFWDAVKKDKRLLCKKSVLGQDKLSDFKDYMDRHHGAWTKRITGMISSVEVLHKNQTSVTEVLVKLRKSQTLIQKQLVIFLSSKEDVRVASERNVQTELIKILKASYCGRSSVNHLHWCHSPRYQRDFMEKLDAVRKRYLSYEAGFARYPDEYSQVLRTGLERKLFTDSEGMVALPPLSIMPDSLYRRSREKGFIVSFYKFFGIFRKVRRSDFHELSAVMNLAVGSLEKVHKELEDYKSDKEHVRRNKIKLEARERNFEQEKKEAVEKKIAEERIIWERKRANEGAIVEEAHAHDSSTDSAKSESRT